MTDVVEAMRHCVDTCDCPTCPVEDKYKGRECITILMARAISEINDLRKVEIPIYDIEEIHHGCTVQVLTSSVTGESSVGWWKEEE